MNFSGKFSTLKTVIGFALARRSGYILGLLKPAPKSITIVLTNRCNSRCAMCDYWRNKHEQEMSFAEISGLLQESARAGVRNVTLYGGEPLLRSDLNKIVAEAKKNKMYIHLITNGFLVSAEKAAELVEAGVDSVVVSIDAVGALNDRIRGMQGAYEKSVSAVLHFQRAAEKSGRIIDIKVSALIMKPTLSGEGIPAILKLCQSLRVSFFPNLLDSSIPYFASADSVDLNITSGEYRKLDSLIEHIIAAKKETPDLVPLSVPAIRFIGRYFRDPECKSVPCCRGMLGDIWVNADGNIHPCAVLPVQGNIRSGRFSEIVLSTGWAELTRKMFRKECPGCSCNYPVNVESSFAFIFQHLWHKLFLRRKPVDRSLAYFRHEENYFVQKGTARYRFASQYIAGKDVLDLGCGARQGPYFLTGTAKHVSGVDVSLEAVEFLKKNYQAPNLDFYQMDAVELKFQDSTFDVIVSFEVIEHIVDFRRYLREIARVLKPGGIVVLSTPNREKVSPDGQAGIRGHIREFSAEEFRKLLSAHFAEVTMFGIMESPRLKASADTEKSVYSLTGFDRLGLRKILPKSFRVGIFKTITGTMEKIEHVPTDAEIKPEDFSFVQEELPSEYDNLVAVCRKKG